MLSISRNLRFNVRNTHRLLINLQQSQRTKSTTPINTVVLFVPQQVKRQLKDFYKFLIIITLGSMDHRKNGKILEDSESRTELSHSHRRSH